ncbi:unnamed protein product [Sphagnum jensenii]|uniref:Uncharacterized protein n=1 Tax=Sphagnum jensenii TaxID=128206 RepID=A0ABP1AE97_9BRYO
MDLFQVLMKKDFSNLLKNCIPSYTFLISWSTSFLNIVRKVAAAWIDCPVTPILANQTGRSAPPLCYQLDAQVYGLSERQEEEQESPESPPGKPWSPI